MIKISKVMDFNKEDDFRAETICRLHTSILRDGEICRNDWVKIQNTTNNSIYRQVKGGSPKNSSKDYIELDYDARLELDIQGNKDENGLIDCELNVTKAKVYDVFKANWLYPNYAIRMAFRVAIIMGSISIILGLIGTLK